ncbi:MAG: hypothetical protein JWQ71_2374 [Pedosphaera sp.]|nr:hypothetical protein [Pedosphaera sp.]
MQYPGAIYHVMNRGDRRESIFHVDADTRDNFSAEIGVDGFGKYRGR